MHSLDHLFLSQIDYLFKILQIMTGNRYLLLAAVFQREDERVIKPGNDLSDFADVDNKGLMRSQEAMALKFLLYIL